MNEWRMILLANIGVWRLSVQLWLIVGYGGLRSRHSALGEQASTVMFMLEVAFIVLGRVGSSDQMLDAPISDEVELGVRRRLFSGAHLNQLVVEGGRCVLR